MNEIWTALVEIEPGQRWAHERTGRVIHLLAVDGDDIDHRYEDDPPDRVRRWSIGQHGLRTHYRPVADD